MGNLRKSKRRRQQSDKSNLWLTKKGELLRDQLALTYIHFLTNNKLLEAEMMIDEMIRRADVMGLFVIDFVNSTTAQLIGIDYNVLSGEEQLRLLIDNPGYIRNLQHIVDKIASETENFEKRMEEEMSKLYSATAHQAFKDYVDLMQESDYQLSEGANEMQSEEKN